MRAGGGKGRRARRVKRCPNFSPASSLQQTNCPSCGETRGSPLSTCRQGPPFVEFRMYTKRPWNRNFGSRRIDEVDDEKGKRNAGDSWNSSVRRVNEGGPGGKMRRKAAHSPAKRKEPSPRVRSFAAFSRAELLARKSRILVSCMRLKFYCTISFAFATVRFITTVKV